MAKNQVKSRRLSINRYVASDQNSKNKESASEVKSRRLNGVRSISGVEYAGGKLGTGVLGVVEGATDLVTGTIAGIFGDKDYKDYVFQYDNWVNDLNQKLDDSYNPGKVGKFIGDVSSGLGQSATMLIPYVGQVAFFTGVMGNSISAASQKTGETGLREYVYGTGSATIEWLLERYISGTGQTLESLGKNTAKNIGTRVTKSIGKTAAKHATKKMVVSQLISSTVGEGFEEFFGNIGDYGWQWITGVDREQEFDWSNALYEGLVGMASGGIMGSVSTTTRVAYETKSGAEINADAKRRDTMLRQARGLVDSAKKQGLDKGSDAVATHLNTIEIALNTYDQLDDRNSGTANRTLGMINLALISGEFNIITDARAKYIAAKSETERAQLAEYANTYFAEAGVKVTAKDMADINNQVTRALATLDWAGKVVSSTLGTSGKLNAEIRAEMDRQQMTEEEAAEKAQKKKQREELARIRAEAKATAKPLKDSSAWNGENATFYGHFAGEDRYITIEKNENGTYEGYVIGKRENDVQKLMNLSEEQVRKIFKGDAASENQAVENNSSVNEETPTKKPNEATSAKNEVENEEESEADEATNTSLGPDSVPLEAKNKKQNEEYVEKEFKATPEEVKRAMKAVKDFKLLPAETREAIIEMMRSGKGIDKVTIQSIAAFMAARQGLHVRFLDRHSAEGSHTVLKTDNNRLILLDPSENNGKHYRADIFFHELYHDFAATGGLNELTEHIHSHAPSYFMRAIADRYTGYYNNGVTISSYLEKDNKKWTEANVKKYFEQYTEISYDEVMEEVAAGTMGRVMGKRSFMKDLRQHNLLTRAYYRIVNLCKVIANRAVEVGGDNTAGFVLTFRDALEYRALYAKALFRSNINLNEKQIRAITEALREAGERDMERATKLSLASKTQDGKLDPRTVTKNDVIDLLTKVKNEEITGNHYIPLRINTPSVLIEWAKKRNNDTIDDNPIAMSADKAYQAMAKKRIGPENRPHKLTVADMIAIIEGMSDPQYIVYQSNGRYVEVVEYETNEKKKAFAILEIGDYKPEWTMSGYEEGLYNVLVTAFPPDRGVITDLLNNKQNKIIYNKKKDASRGTPGSMVPSVSNETSFFKNSISQSTPNVNTKLSLSLDTNYLDAVNRGDTETAQRMVDEAAERAMPNSLVRDGAGKLLKVYHGSPSKFTIFKHSKINAHGNAHGRGFYFTDYKSLAEGYLKDGGQLLEGYLNIEKPLSEEKVTIKKSELLKLIKATCEAEAKQLVEEDGYENIKEALPDTWLSNYVMTYGMNINTAYREVADIIYSGSDNDVDMIAEITNESGGSETALTLTHDILGYDGVIFTNEQGHHEYVMLVSNQFKSADPVTYDDDGNVIPLSERFNSEKKDIRYSLSLDGDYAGNIKIPSKDIETGKKLAKFIDDINQMNDKSKANKRKYKIGPLSAQNITLINKIMQKENPEFSAEGYELWIDGTAALHIEERHGENGKQDHTMEGNDAKTLIYWASQNATAGDFMYENGEIKKSNRFDNYDQSAATEILLETDITDSVIYISECVPDSQKKRIWITSAYRKIKKDSRGQLLNMEENSTLQLTPEAPDGDAISSSISQPSANVKSKLSLSLSDYAPTVSKEDLEAELNRVKWNFEWTDEALRDNIMTVRKYVTNKHPNVAVSIEIDNDQKHITVTSVSRTVDFDYVDEADAALHDFFKSLGIREDQIGAHLSLFNTNEKKQVLDTVAKQQKANREQNNVERPKVYYKNQVTRTVKAVLENVISPIVGTTKMKGADQRQLINWLWKKMNSATTKEEKTKIANAVAEGFISRAIYDDLEVNREYEEMLVNGTIEEYNAVRSYLGNIKADTVEADVLARYDTKQGKQVLRKWRSDDGISIKDAIGELQSEGYLLDVTAKNEADMLIALNDEYDRLKSLTELRREWITLANADPEQITQIREQVSNMILGFFDSWGKDTKYGKLRRRYQELIAERDQKHAKEIAEIEERLTDRTAKLITKVKEEADRKVSKMQSFYDRRLQESKYGHDYAKRLNRISADGRRLRDYVNRDYTAADQMEDRQTKGIAKAFLKAMTRTGVKAQQAREAAQIMLTWAENAQKDNENFIGTDPMQSAMTQEELDAIKLLAANRRVQTLTDEELAEIGASREKYEAAMQARANESLSLDELEQFHTALKVAIRNYQSYDMFWTGERWIGINEKANEAVAIVQEGNEKFQKEGWLKKIGQSIRKIAMPFLDPLSIAASIDGFRYDGVFQDLINKLAYAEAEKNKMVIELRRPFEAFLEKNKKYQKRLSEEIIELEDGFKITVGQAITLTELNKRDQAKTALAISRLAFRMDDGTVRKLEGFDKLPQITTPSGQKIPLVKAQELVRGLQITPDTAIAELKEKGYDERTLTEFERAVAKAEAEALPLIAQFGEKRQQLIAKIEKQLNDEDRAFIKVVSDFFQKTSKEAKTKADLRNLGYTNVIEGYYFPIKRRSADMAKDISDGTPFTDFITTVNLSFNQSIVPNAKASIDVANVWDIVNEHINGLAMWEHLYLPIQNINKIYNKNVNTGTGTTNVLSVKSLLDERTEAKYGAWLKDLLLDVQGARQRETKTVFDTEINKIRGTYAVYQLGFNPQTVVKQTLSWAAAAQYLSPSSIAKGLIHPKLNAKELDRVSAVAAERMGEATVVKALSNTEKVSKIGEKTMWGISKMDRFVNEALFAMCQEEIAARDPKKTIGSEENIVEAGKLVSEVILKVQDSSDVSTKSQAARSSNELVKAFTMFQSAGLKMFSRIFENVGFVVNYKHMYAENQSKYGAQYKKAQKQLARSVGAAAAVAVLTAIIVQAFKFLYDKDREDKDGNEITVAEDLATDAATELVGFIPVIGDIVDYFVNGYEMSNFFEDTANDTLKAFTQIFGLLGKVTSGDVIESWEVGSMLRKVSRAAGSLTGIPVRNVENVLSGLVRRFFPEAGYTYDTLFYRANYSEDIKKALNEGDTELAGHILELMIKRDKTGGNAYSDETIEALIGLRNIGFDVFPKSPEIDKMNRKTLREFEEIYQKADTAVEKLVNSEAFKAMEKYGTDESSPQATAIKTIYNAYYDLAEYDVLDKELTRSAAYFTVTDPHDLILVKAYDKAIKLETVELKGSRKAMLKAYMKSLGMDTTAQAYAAYSCGFKTDDVVNKIKTDLKGKDNEEELLIALGLIKKEDEEAA